MDFPIFYPVSVRRKARVDDDYDMCILISLSHDDKDEFLRLLKDPKWINQYPLAFIFENDSVKCVNAILDGETKGIIDIEDKFPPATGFTPLHLAAAMGAPRITNMLFQKAYGNIDVDNHYNRRTPLDYALYSHAEMFKTSQPRSLFQMLLWIFLHTRGCLEVMRMLIQKSKAKARITQAFINYAHEGKLLQVTMLFLAAPELFSSALVTLQLEKRTDIEERLSLLLDVFATVGDMLAAYIRLEKTTDHSLFKTQLAIDFFLREATRKKLGVDCPGYYMRFHLTPGADQWRSHDNANCMDDWGFKPSRSMFNMMDVYERCKDFDQDYVYSKLPCMKPKSADRLQRTFKKKLSSMPPLVGFLKAEVEKTLPYRLYFSHGRTTVPAMRAFCTSVASARIKFDFNSRPANSLENKMIKLAPAKAMSIFSGMKPSHFPMIAKRLIK